MTTTASSPASASRSSMTRCGRRQPRGAWRRIRGDHGLGHHAERSARDAGSRAQPRERVLLRALALHQQTLGALDDLPRRQRLRRATRPPRGAPRARRGGPARPRWPAAGRPRGTASPGIRRRPPRRPARRARPARTPSASRSESAAQPGSAAPPRSRRAAASSRRGWRGRALAPGELDRLLAVLRRGAHLEARVLERLLEVEPDDGLVLGDQDQAHSAARYVGARGRPDHEVGQPLADRRRPGASAPRDVDTGPGEIAPRRRSGSRPRRPARRRPPLGPSRARRGRQPFEPGGESYWLIPNAVTPRA